MPISCATVESVRRSVGRVLREAAVRVPPLESLAAKVSLRPWEEPLMEITHGTWHGMFAFKDVEGRQLGEANTQPEWLRQKLAPEEWMPCRYAGSRQGRSFNVAALRQVAGVWREVLSDVGRMRAVYMNQMNLKGPLCPLDLYMLARVTSSIPAFLARGPNRVADGDLPARFAALFKTMGGVHMTVDRMLDTHADVDKPWAAEDLFDYIEAQNLFVSSQGNACGGPRKMVVELLRAAIAGHPCDPLPDEQAMLRYGLAAARIELVWGRRALAVRPLLGERPASDAAYARVFDATRLGRWEGAGSTSDQDYVRLEQCVLGHLNAAAGEIARVLQRPKVPVTRRIFLARQGRFAQMLKRRGWKLEVRGDRIRVRGLGG